MILESIEHGSLIWPTIEEIEMTRTKKYDELSATEKLQADCDMKAINIILQVFRCDTYFWGCYTEGIECLPNEEIFTELARMGYEKPSTKLTFYKAFFSSRKFNFSKYIFDSLVRNMDSSTKFYMYPRFLQLMIRAQVGDLSSHTTKYSSPALTQKVFANIRRVGKGCSGIETPLFEGMIVEQPVGEGADEVHVEDVFAAGVTAEGDASVANDEVHAAIDEPSIPSPPPPTQPPPTSQDIPSTSQAQPTPPPSPIAQPQSPQHQPQPSQDAGISMDHLHNLLDTCITLTRRVEHLEQDNIAQALEITKLKQRVKKLERRNKLKVIKVIRLKKVGIAQEVKTSDDTVMDDVSKQGRIIADLDADKDVTLKDVAVVAKDVQDAEIEESSDDVDLEPVELQEVVEVVTTAKLITEVVTIASAIITVDAPQLTVAAAPTLTTAPSAARRRKGVVIRDPEETATPSIIIYFEAKSKDKGKWILVEERKPLKKQAQIEQDEAYARELEAELNKNIDWDEVINHVQRKQKEDNDVKRYQALKRKPQTEAQARKNMMIYLRNVVGFKMDYFKGMTYNDIRPIFKKKFNSNVAFLQKTNEQMDEEDSRALKKLSESQEDKAAKKQKLDEKVAELKRHLQIVPNDEDDVYTKATPLARKKLVKERFASTKPKNFSNDFLLITLGAMFEKPDVQAQIWKNQRSVHGQVKVKSWKQLESCGVQFITFTTTQLILLVERRYPLSRFTLNQLINTVRLEVEEESEVSLEMLRFIRQQQQEGFKAE
nr:hypothetical protein [Tanacetum cinerariifolium]